MTIWLLIRLRHRNKMKKESKSQHDHRLGILKDLELINLTEIHLLSLQLQPLKGRILQTEWEDSKLNKLGDQIIKVGPNKCSVEMMTMMIKCNNSTKCSATHSKDSRKLTSREKQSRTPTATWLDIDKQSKWQPQIPIETKVNRLDLVWWTRIMFSCKINRIWLTNKLRCNKRCTNRIWWTCKQACRTCSSRWTKLSGSSSKPCRCLHKVCRCSGIISSKINSVVSIWIRGWRSLQKRFNNIWREDREVLDKIC